MFLPLLQISLLSGTVISIFEEAIRFLALEEDPPSSEVDPTYQDPEGDILLLEAILNNKPVESSVMNLPRLNSGLPPSILEYAVRRAMKLKLPSFPQRGPNWGNTIGANYTARKDLDTDSIVPPSSRMPTTLSTHCDNCQRPRKDYATG
ncbi:hypothetical protein Tco_0630899 [Tanacetum coccineum]